jgi:iron(III) transport system ATP-binding protein
VAEVLELVELSGLSNHYPHQLSGGQQQRVALARALSASPSILLLDEPFSNLDAKLRERSRKWLRALQQEIGITTVFVTHDQDEALGMSDRVMVMNHGVVEQSGPPEEIYLRPVSRFVADFVGRCNFVEGVIVGTGPPGRVTVRVKGTPMVVRAHCSHEVSEGTEVVVAVRPEAIELGPAPVRSNEAFNQCRAEILSGAFLGDHYEYEMSMGGVSVMVQTTQPAAAPSLVVTLPDGAATALG